MRHSTPINTFFDDEPPWQARSLADDGDWADEAGWSDDADDAVGDEESAPTAADVTLDGGNRPAWRRVGSRGMAAILAALMLMGVAGLQAADAWRGPRACRRITADSSPELVARCNAAKRALGSTSSPATSRSTATTGGPVSNAAPPTYRTPLTNPPPEVVGTPATSARPPTTSAAAARPAASPTGGAGTGNTGNEGSTTETVPAMPGRSPAASNPSGNAPMEAMAGGNANQGSGAVFEGLRNNQAQFTAFANTPADQLDVNALTIPADRTDNGPQNGEGQFRIACQYSHFSYDDPIVYPGQPGMSHLHMFWGNTGTNAFSTTSSLVNSGGGTCDGFELNRTAYWTPALLDGNNTAIVPREIIVYYKSKYPSETVAMPQGLKLVAGNPKNETFTPSDALHWSCGGSDSEYNRTNRIPDCGGDTIKAVMEFPNCWDGVNLDSADHRSHMATSNDAPCPADHPVRFPQITILLYYAGTSSVNGWHLSSDNFKGFNTGPGGTLHGDWMGGWNNTAMDMWTNGCIRAVRDCSYGQTGTNRQLAPISETQTYTGPTQLSLPAGSYQMG